MYVNPVKLVLQRHGFHSEQTELVECGSYAKKAKYFFDEGIVIVRASVQKLFSV